MPSMYTSPVNQSPGPVAVSPELGVIFMVWSVSVLGSVGGSGCLFRCCPGGEEPESFGGGGAWLGRVDEKHEAGLGGDGQLFVGEGELAGDGVIETFGPGAVGADVVVGPQAAKGVAAGGEFSDQIL